MKSDFPFEDLNIKMRNLDIQSIVNDLEPRELKSLNFVLDLMASPMTLEEVGENLKLPEKELDNCKMNPYENEKILTEKNKQKTKEELHKELIERRNGSFA